MFNLFCVVAVILFVLSYLVIVSHFVLSGWVLALMTIITIVGLDYIFKLYEAENERFRKQ